MTYTMIWQRNNKITVAENRIIRKRKIRIVSEVSSFVGNPVSKGSKNIGESAIGARKKSINH